MADIDNRKMLNIGADNRSTPNVVCVCYSPIWSLSHDRNGILSGLPVGPSKSPCQLFWRRGLWTKRQLHALKCEKPRPLRSLGSSRYRLFSLMKEWPAALPQQPANLTGLHTGWPLLPPLARSTVPGGLNTIGNKGSTTASPGPQHHHIHENTHQNITDKALLGSLSIQGHFRQHPCGGSVPNHSCSLFIWSSFLGHFQDSNSCNGKKNVVPA